MDTTIETQNVISFCTGLRGIERGLERTGMSFRDICYVEIEAFIIANLVAAMETGVLAEAPIWTNLKTFDAVPFRRVVHGITGGYPCQPFSNSGYRKGTEDPRHLFPYILKSIDIIRPVWCFFENVPGHITLGYDEVYRSLSDLGYSVEVGVFSAREVGATSVRKRLFILAIRRDFIYNGDEQYGQWCRRVWGWGGKSGRNSEELGDTNSEGLQGSELDRASDQGASEWEHEPLFSISEPSRTSWPAEPLLPQHEWEGPRTIKPSLVYTADGYNFREDLIRAIGNSVVEQTAELAFLTLSRKHYESIKKD